MENHDVTGIFSIEHLHWTLFHNINLLSLFSIILYSLTCWISRIQNGGSFTPLVTTCQLWIWPETLYYRHCVINLIENYQNFYTNYQILQILCEKFYWKLQTFKYKLPNIEIMWEILLKIRKKLNTNYKILQR
jgi:hypothetical protein